MKDILASIKLVLESVIGKYRNGQLARAKAKKLNLAKESRRLKSLYGSPILKRYGNHESTLKRLRTVPLLSYFFWVSLALSCYFLLWPFLVTRHPHVNPQHHSRTHNVQILLAGTAEAAVLRHLDSIVVVNRHFNIA